MTTPNKAQQELIENHHGIYKVDAGAGTGKTYAITLRYIDILTKQNADPQDILLLTFTNNAAQEMKERIINKSTHNSKKLQDAPISTFHSLAKNILTENGFNTPHLLGIQDNITSSTTLIGDQVLEQQEFKSFIDQFIQQHPEYNHIYKTLHTPQSLLGLIKTLASKGIIPTKKAWYGDTEQHLNGDYEAYKELLHQQNQQRGSKSSQLRNNSYSTFKKCLHPDAPTQTQVRGPTGTKKANLDYFKKAFKDNRETLKQFVHNVYHEYIQYSLSKNYLNFNLLLVFTYLLLAEKPRIRQKYTYTYTMIDEFQDTNEIQLKLAMMLSQGNICVVGDWKQSIYKFQHADVENMTRFQKRLKKYKQELNTGTKRIQYNVEDVKEITLTQNYRSTQKILRLSEKTLNVPGKKHEDVQTEPITKLESNNNQPSQIQAFQSDKETDAILHKIQQIVQRKEYTYNNKKLDYEDIAVLTRNRTFGLKLQEKAQQLGIPAAFEGGITLFTTKPAILLLAWLRILTNNASKGWAVILEDTGYNLDTINHIIKQEDYPQNLLAFKKKLQNKDITTTTKKIFNKYNLDNGITQKILQTLQNTYKTTYKTKADLIQYIEQNIDQEETHNVDNKTTQKAITIQTIHAAKGLQYPAVFIADINQRRFPSQSKNNNVITFNETTGLRHTKTYCPETNYVYDNWKTRLVNTTQTQDYDEERRLLYVATTRAQNYLFLSATKQKPSTFFTELPIEKQELNTTLEPIHIQRTQLPELTIPKPTTRAAVKKTAHTDLELIKNKQGRGKDYGTKIHRFAYNYATNQEVKPQDPDQKFVKQTIDNLEGDIQAEVPIIMPIQGSDDERKTVYTGVIDLLHITQNKVEIIDWKTDQTKENHKEYTKQIETYKKGIQQIYPDKKVEAKILYTGIN